MRVRLCSTTMNNLKINKMKDDLKIILDKKLGGYETLEIFLSECESLADELSDKDPFKADTDGLRVYTLIEMVRKSIENV